MRWRSQEEKEMDGRRGQQPAGGFDLKHTLSIKTAVMVYKLTGYKHRNNLLSEELTKGEKKVTLYYKWVGVGE